MPTHALTTPSAITPRRCPCALPYDARIITHPAKQCRVSCPHSMFFSTFNFQLSTLNPSSPFTLLRVLCALCELCVKHFSPRPKRSLPKPRPRSTLKIPTLRSVGCGLYLEPAKNLDQDHAPSPRTRRPLPSFLFPCPPRPIHKRLPHRPRDRSLQSPHCGRKNRRHKRCHKFPL